MIVFDAESKEKLLIDEVEILLAFAINKPFFFTGWLPDSMTLRSHHSHPVAVICFI